MSTIDKKVIQAKKLIHCLNNASSKELMNVYPDMEELFNTIDCMIDEGSLSTTLINSLKEMRQKVALSFHSSESVATSKSEISQSTENFDQNVEIRTKQQTKKVVNTKPVSDTASAAKIQQLLQDQKDSHAKQIEQEQRTKTKLVEELTELTSALKETTLSINKSVNLQNVQLDSVQKHAAENEIELDEQKAKLKERTNTATKSILSGIGMFIWIIVLFILCYFVIRLFPKPSSAPTCKASY